MWWMYFEKKWKRGVMVVIVLNNYGLWMFIVWNILVFIILLNINLYLDKNINKNKLWDIYVFDNIM